MLLNFKLMYYAIIDKVALFISRNLIIKYSHQQNKQKRGIHSKMLDQQTKGQRKKFAILLAVVQIIVTIMFGIFMKVKSHNDTQLNQTYYPLFQDINVMMLIGFGFVMTFIKGYTWSALGYTFFINAVVIQLYLLFHAFWNMIFRYDGFHYTFTITEKDFILASYAVATMLIAFGAIIGRVGPLDMLVVAIVGVFGYTLNYDIVYNQLKLFDAGGSTSIHAFGAYYGLMVSFFLGRTQEGNIVKIPKSNKISNTFAMIGTLFLWMYFPSFNAGYYPTYPVQRTIIITNTIVSLTASCLGAFLVSAILHRKFQITDIIHATLVGGIIIGAPCGMIMYPAVAFAIGLLGGIFCIYCSIKLTEKLQRNFHIQDTCGVDNFHGLPGFIGGLISAIVISSYNSLGIPEDYKSYLPFSDQNNIYKRTFTQQAGIQVAGTFMSVGIAVFTGLVAGIILTCFYETKAQTFFEDKYNFQIPEEVERMNVREVTQEQILQQN